MTVDIVFAIFFLYGFYLGFSNGIIRTVFTVVSIVFGLVAAFKFTPATQDFLQTAFDDANPLWFFVGFALTFVVQYYYIAPAVDWTRALSSSALLTGFCARSADLLTDSPRTNPKCDSNKHTIANSSQCDQQ